MAIKYTEAFKNKVKRVHGNSLNNYLEQGSPALRIVLQSFPSTVSIDEILKTKTLKDIRNKAKLVKDNLELIDEWWQQPGV